MRHGSKSVRFLTHLLLSIVISSFLIGCGKDVPVYITVPLKECPKPKDLELLPFTEAPIYHPTQIEILLNNWSKLDFDRVLWQETVRCYEEQIKGTDSLQQSEADIVTQK